MFRFYTDNREAQAALRMVEAIAELTQGDGESVTIYHCGSTGDVHVCAQWTNWVTRRYPGSTYEALMSALRDKRKHTP